MEFINRSLSQLADLFRSMTPGARITSVLLVAVIVISLVYLVTFQYQGGGEYLFGGHEFSERELQLIEAAFAKAELGRWDRVGSRIRIPRGKEPEYLAALAEGNAIPVDFNTIFDQMISGGSVFESRQSRELKLKLLRQKYLGMVLAQLPGVRDATVQFDETPGSGFNRATKQTAMAAILPDGTRGLRDDLVETVRYTVSSMVAGLSPEDVTVTDLAQGRVHPGRSNQGERGELENVYAKNKKLFENYWRDKIYDGLRMYPGIVVGVNVELDPHTKSTTNSVKYDPKPVNLQSDQASSSQESEPFGGRPGAVPNLAVGNRPLSAGVSRNQRNTSEERSESQQSITGHEETIAEQTGLIPQSVSASIGLPNSYVVKVWKKENPTPEGQDPVEPTEDMLQQIETELRDKIQNAVVAMMPPVNAGVSKFAEVNFHTFDDFDPEPPEAPSVVSGAGGWLASNWQTIGLFILGGVGLMMFRNMIRSTLQPEQESNANIAADLMPATIPISGETGGSSSSEDEELDADAGLRRYRAQGPDLRSELASVVKEDPDAAANVLRSWIGDAA